MKLGKAVLLAKLAKIITELFSSSRKFEIV
jgi:hypothetical protein